MPRRYHFHEKWLEKDAYKSWLRKDNKNSNKAFCFACKKSINLKVMGESAFVSHMKDKKDKEYLKNLQGNEKTTKIGDFFSPLASTSMAKQTGNRLQQPTGNIASGHCDWPYKGRVTKFSSWLKCNTEGRDSLDTQGNKEPLLI